MDRAYSWMAGRLGKVSTEGKAAPENVKQQIRHYIATRGIIQDFGLDFVGIKCHYELSEVFRDELSQRHGAERSLRLGWL